MKADLLIGGQVNFYEALPLTIRVNSKTDRLQSLVVSCSVLFPINSKKIFLFFREFYYIQMEKYARQAVSEGVKSADDLHVSGDSEIYRVLNLHYNRNNHIEVCRNQVRLSLIKLENKKNNKIIPPLTYTVL